MLGVFLIVLVLQFLITQVGTAVFETTPLSAAMWGKMLLTAGSVAVSYTHLDVYKRQPVEWEPVTFTSAVQFS